ncbi:MAG: hypothetical protein IJK67_06430 [Bacilli bacterium]|nr:hypothetical protein [Bacilli bacterium]
MTKKYKNSVIIDGDNVIKNKGDNSLSTLFDYLDDRGFNSHPKIIDEDENTYTMKHIKSENYYEMSRGVEFIKTVSSLHSKTIFYKDVNKNKYRKIYNQISNNIEYLKKYYLELIEKVEQEIYMSPSHYLFARNYSVIDSSLEYSKKELKKWFDLVSNKTKERVCIIHNNLSLDHFMKEGGNYLISWDKHMVDTPILDLYNFYKREGYKLDFNYLLKIYNENLELLKEEKMLLNILISIPLKLEEINDEYLNTINIKNMIDYVCCGITIVNENK